MHTVHHEASKFYTLKVVVSPSDDHQLHLFKHVASVHYKPGADRQSQMARHTVVQDDCLKNIRARIKKIKLKA